MRGYKPSKQGRQIHLQLMSSRQTYCDLIVRRYWNSPCQNKFVTGADITEHLPQLKLQLADGSHSALNTNVVMFKNTIKKICRLINSIKSILYQLITRYIFFIPEPTFQLVRTALAENLQSRSVLFQQGESDMLAFSWKPSLVHILNHKPSSSARTRHAWLTWNNIGYCEWL